MVSLENTEVTLYTTGCPQCHVLEAKLNQKKVHYTSIFGEDEIIRLGFTSAPLLKVGDEVLDFMKAVKYINSL